MGIAIIIPEISFSDANLGNVTLSGNVPISSISIVGIEVVNDRSNQARYSIDYNPAKTTQRGIVWSIDSGGEYASIDSTTGVLTALAGASSSPVVIRATSSANSTIYATKNITVSYRDEPVFKTTLLFDGASAIDTGIDASAQTEVQVTLAECNPSSWASNGGYRFSTIIGGRVSSSSKRRDIQLATSATSSITIIYFGTGNKSLETRVGVPAGDELYVAQGQTFGQYNETTIQLSVPSFDSTVHYIIGAQNNDGTLAYTYASHDKFKRVKIYATEGGTLLRDFVPAVLGSESGMYDMVSGNFFTNIGSGTLVAE